MQEGRPMPELCRVERDGVVTIERPEVMNASYDGIVRMIKSEDFAEDPRAFAEKRPQSWKGR